MINKLRVQRFKSIKDSTWLSLHPLTVIIGRNGSGKRSLIDALVWLSTAIDANPAIASANFTRTKDLIRFHNHEDDNFEVGVSWDPQDVSIGDAVEYVVSVGSEDNGQLDRPVILTETLSVHGGREKELLIKSEDDVRLVSVPPTASEVRSVHREKDRNLIGSEGYKPTWVRYDDPRNMALSTVDKVRGAGGFNLKEAFRKTTLLRLHPPSIGGFSPIASEGFSRLLDPEGEGVAEMLEKLSTENREILMRKLKKVFPHIQNVSSNEPKTPADQRFISISEQKGKGYSTHSIPGWVLSEGVRRLSAILGLLLLEPAIPLLIIEEVENGFDPWTLEFVLENLREASRRGTQVILTTHSPLLLDWCSPEQVLLAERVNPESGTSYSYVSENDDAKSVLLQMGVGEAYVENFLQREDT